MTGRPDYDVGDLVVIIGESSTGLFKTGSAYTCTEVYFNNTLGAWGANVAEVSPLPFHRGWRADRFRKLDPKPPEFWTREVEAPVKVDA